MPLGAHVHHCALCMHEARRVASLRLYWTTATAQGVVLLLRLTAEGSGAAHWHHEQLGNPVASALSVFAWNYSSLQVNVNVSTRTRTTCAYACHLSESWTRIELRRARRLEYEWGTRTRTRTRTRANARTRRQEGESQMTALQLACVAYALTCLTDLQTSAQ